MQVLPNNDSRNQGERVTTVSTKGQVTIPTGMRAILGVKPKDAVSLKVVDDTVIITKAIPKVDVSFQAIPALTKSLSPEAMTRIAKKTHAREVAREGME